MSETRYRIWQFLLDETGVFSEQLQPDETLSGLDMDEIDLIQLACAIEEEFSVKVNDDQLGPEATIKQVSEYIEGLIA